MKRKLMIGFVLFFIAISLGFIGYFSGYPIGQLAGWSEGHNDALSSYPRMSMDNLQYTSDNITITFGNITIIGEQHIIDFISDLPNFDRIISFGTYK